MVFEPILLDWDIIFDGIPLLLSFSLNLIIFLLEPAWQLSTKRGQPERR